jgi:5-methylcytosine-specific restriction endonuclease McrA
MNLPEIEELFARLEYHRDVRRPPDERRRGRFRAGWEDAAERLRVYEAETLERLTWHNLGYRLGRRFGRQPAEQIDEAFEILAGLYDREGRLGEWRSALRRSLRLREHVSTDLAGSIVSFFELAFQNTRCPQKAWFGIHSSTISLVVGGIFLAAIVRSGKDRGFLLLVDQRPPSIDGVEYRPVRSTQGSRFPLIWAHSSSLHVIPNVVANSHIWESFSSASEKILHSSKIAGDRDAVQERRGKRRLEDLLRNRPGEEERDQIRLPEEVPSRSTYSEGSVQPILVNRYERDPRAREECIRHYGATCFLCGFDFLAEYGEVMAGFIHVHHLKPLSAVGADYQVDPVQDLRPVCPNCHAVLHRREPPYSLEEVRQFLQARRGEAR